MSSYPDDDSFDFMEAIGWVSPRPRPASGRYPNLSPGSSRRFQKSGQLWIPQSPSPPDPLAGIWGQFRLYQPLVPPLPGFVSTIRLAEPQPLPVGRRQMPVVGYRAWDAVQVSQLGVEARWELESLATCWRWKAGTNTAECNVSAHAVVPDETCVCGLYVCSDLAVVQAQMGEVRDHTVVGLVMGWGRVVQHGEEGWRAQHARPLALLDLKRGPENSAITNAVAESYGLRVLGRPALELLAREHGDPLPGNG